MAKKVGCEEVMKEIEEKIGEFNLQVINCRLEAFMGALREVLSPGVLDHFDSCPECQERCKEYVILMKEALYINLSHRSTSDIIFA